MASNVLRSRIAEGDWVSSRTWSYRDAVKSPFIKKETKLRRKYVSNLLNEPQHMAKIKTPKRLQIPNKGVTNLRERKLKTTD